MLTELGLTNLSHQAPLLPPNQYQHQNATPSLSDSILSSLLFILFDLYLTSKCKNSFEKCRSFQTVNRIKVSRPFLKFSYGRQFESSLFIFKMRQLFPGQLVENSERRKYVHGFEWHCLYLYSHLCYDNSNYFKRYLGCLPAADDFRLNEVFWLQIKKTP